MPRSGWLALGAIAAAWAAANLSLSWAVALTALGVAGVAAAWVMPADREGRVVLVGAALIVARLVAGGGGSGAPPVIPEGRGPWTFVVEATGAARDGNQTATLRSDRAGVPSIRVAATLPAYPAIVAGDVVTVEGPIRPRPATAYGDYLERIGAVGTITARSIEVAPRPVDAAHIVEDARQAAATALAAALPEPEAGLAAGILIGLRDRVDRDLAAAFTTAGVSHVVAISGWNIAIVAAAVAAVAGRMGRRRRSVVTMAAIVAYVVFAGASASVVRAGAMAAVVLLARESGRAGRAAAALGWAATILLVADPGLVGDAGFQLSALATAGLIAWATPATDAIERFGKGRVPHWLAESLGVSLAAQLATLPVILVAFGRLAILAPAVNLVIVPLVAPAMAAGLLALLGGGLALAGAPPVVAAILAVPGWVSLRLMVAIVDTAAAIPFASVTLPAPVAWTVAIATVVAIVVVRHRRARIPGRASANGPGPRGAPGPPAGGVVDVARHASGDPRARGERRHRRCRRDQPPQRRRARLGDGCRPGRRDPRRGLPRRTAADRWRPRPRASADRPRCPDPAVGPADRRRDPHPPARGPRGRARPAARSIPHPTRVRAGDARTRAGLRGLAVAAHDRWGAGPTRARARRPADGRRHRPARAVADPRAGPGGTA